MHFNRAYDERYRHGFERLTATGSLSSIAITTRYSSGCISPTGMSRASCPANWIFTRKELGNRPLKQASKPRPFPLDRPDRSPKDEPTAGLNSRWNYGELALDDLGREAVEMPYTEATQFPCSWATILRAETLQAGVRFAAITTKYSAPIRDRFASWQTTLIRN